MKRIEKVYLSPSLYAHVANGFLIFTSIVIFVRYYTKIMSLEPYKLIILSLLFSIVVGIHGLSHMGLEANYGYNPITKLTSPPQ